MPEEVHRQCLTRMRERLWILRETILETVLSPLQDFAHFVEDDRVVLHKLQAQKDHICSGMLQNQSDWCEAGQCEVAQVLPGN